jgi:hypothetical protein
MDADPALLTRSELDFLPGKKKVSKSYEYRIRSDIRRKQDVRKFGIAVTE